MRKVTFQFLNHVIIEFVHHISLERIKLNEYEFMLNLFRYFSDILFLPIQSNRSFKFLQKWETECQLSVSSIHLKRVVHTDM